VLTTHRREALVKEEEKGELARCANGGRNRVTREREPNYPSELL
jgi:hypothetical protein